MTHVTGIIEADGADATERAGGGSGGGILLETDSLYGKGSIHANGGKGSMFTMRNESVSKIK